MNDPLVSRTTVLAITLWTAAAVVLVTSWGVMLLDPDGWRWAGMLAATSLAVTGLAMVLHIRTYALRILRLVGATARRTEDQRGEVHSVS